MTVNFATRAIRVATAADAEAIARIYAPIVADTVIAFEVVVPGGDEIRQRIVTTLERFPWLVSEDANGTVDGYVYAGRHRERAAYQWSVDVSAYVREDARGRGVGKRLYTTLLGQLTELGYHQAFAGIALPNAASIALHRSVGFTHVGIYRNVGFKHGAWHDVGWWQRSLRPLDVPREPLPFAGDLR